MGAKDTDRQTIVYSEGYAAPEQMHGDAELRSDLFSLAATLYHLATGKKPIGYNTTNEIEALLNDPATPIPDEYRWFFELLQINLAFDPNDRYCTVAEFKADLEKQCLTKEISCPECRAVNPVRSPYCVRCAAALTPESPPCRTCGETNRMGSRWCHPLRKPTAMNHTGKSSTTQGVFAKKNRTVDYFAR